MLSEDAERTERSEQTNLCFQTDQSEEYFASRTINNRVALRLLSLRSREAQTQELVNQDYAQVVASTDGSALYFCVCDGVGSSYRGDFAAHYLGSALVAWLQEREALTGSIKAIAARLRQRMNEWAQAAQEELRRLPLAPDTPALVREVLEELREDYGSETVFLAGRIALASWETPLQVARPMEAFLCWMGNVSARLFVTGEHSFTLGGSSDDEGRWSTARGSRGLLNAWSMGLSTIERLIVYTDGLLPLASSLTELNDDELQTRARELLLLPENDDMTALDLHWLPQKERRD
ncbi:protein phosphatase 2C domain-containing protein [Thermogemmatispora sp.]|uniref:protein phosphatase 2C domain-containing protein n=1 Tax=Thermogemmatispora sp. TaxID=1968838 RepID=UPI001D93AE03|nr:protein phosphatase 2C domain-containing protein [Thermogemmatispora sp.]MBX5452013.1 protein phosphatase 2C domain-containing protein [Thermogemmatispora sp.]